jgi:soluble epoxide hydrolase/lipid-phosphate phosphatase
MEAFEKKTIKACRDYTYTYYTIDSDPSLSAPFLQHS